MDSARHVGRTTSAGGAPTGPGPQRPAVAGACACTKTSGRGPRALTQPLSPDAESPRSGPQPAEAPGVRRPLPTVGLLGKLRGCARSSKERLGRGPGLRTPARDADSRPTQGDRPTWKQSHSRLARSHRLRGRQPFSSHFSPRGSARPRPKPSLAPPPRPSLRPPPRPASLAPPTDPAPPQDKTGPCPIAAELYGPASHSGPAPSLGLCTLAAARTAPTAKRECHQSATLSRQWTPSPGSALGSVEQVLSGCQPYPARTTRPAGSLLPEVGIPALPLGVQPLPYRTMLCEKDSPFLELSPLPPFPSNGERSRDRKSELRKPTERSVDE